MRPQFPHNFHSDGLLQVYKYKEKKWKYKEKKWKYKENKSVCGQVFCVLHEVNY